MLCQKKAGKNAMSNALQHYHIVYLCHCLFCVNSFMDDAVVVVIWLLDSCVSNASSSYINVCLFYIFFAIYLFFCLGIIIVYTESTARRRRKINKRTNTHGIHFLFLRPPLLKELTEVCYLKKSSMQSNKQSKTKQTKHKPR